MKVAALTIGYLALMWLLGCQRPAIDQAECARGIVPHQVAEIMDSVEDALRMDNWNTLLSLAPDHDAVSCAVRALLANPQIYHPDEIQTHGQAWLAQHGGKP